MVGGVVFGPDRRVTMAAMVTMFVLPMVSVDVSKRTEVTNNVRAASMRPKRRDRERRRCIFFMVFFFLVGQSNSPMEEIRIRIVEYFCTKFVSWYFFFFWFRMVDIYIFSGWLVTIGGWRRRWWSNVA